MSDDSKFGLSRRELEYEVRWMLRRVPQDPEKLAQRFSEILVALIDKNNAAIAKSMADQERSDLPEGS